MKKFFNKCCKKINLNKVFAFVILEVFILSFGALSITSDESIQRSSWIDLTYSFDKNNDILKLSWNNVKLPDDKYYVFKKGQYDIEYIMISDSKGIDNNYYITSLNDNIGAYFVVCTTPEIKSLPDDVYIFSVDKDNDDYVGKFKKLRDCVKTESNVVCIKLYDILNENLFKYVEYKNDKEDKNIIKKEEAIEILKNNEFTENKKIITEKTIITKNNSNNDEEEEKYDIRKDLMFALSNINNNKGKYQVEGMYKLNNDGETDIDYKGIRMKVPDDAAEDDSFIYIKLLEKDELHSIPTNAPNITNVDESDKYYGYDINLFVKKERSAVPGDDIDEELNKKIAKIMESSEEYVWVIENKFLKDIDLSLQYNGEDIPKYINEGSSFVYYYDENTERWINLTRAGLDKSNNWIACKTNHFCQFYAGTMTIQGEPPQAKGINTDPVNIQEADPMEGIWGLPDIDPNNRGTLDFSYNLSVPNGINKLTPSIYLTYNNDTKEGNCGYGWDLPISNIRIKTKNLGVPKYDGNDQLMLDKMDLIYIGNNVYRSKNENNFYKIVKTGNSFIVYAVDGKKFYYGESSESRLYDPDNTNHIFTWYLFKIEDKFGNIIKYHYNTIKNNNKLVNRYPVKIEYCFIGGTPNYTIELTWQDRSDIRESYISGFLVRHTKLLDKINIKYADNNNLKTYDLAYSNGAFGKSLLTCLKEIVNGEEINSHSFTYNKEISDYFSGRNKWDTEDAFDNTNKPVFYCDVNGDGLIDLLKQDSTSSSSEEAKIYANLNQGYDNKNFKEGKKWLDIQAGSNEWLDSENLEIVDYTGDGVFDFCFPIAIQVSYHMEIGYYRYVLNNCMKVPGNSIDHDTDAADFFADINGDNKTDIIKKHAYVPSNSGPYVVPESYWFVQIRTGKNSFDSEYMLPNADIEKSFSVDKDERLLIDINGDGLSDNNCTNREAMNSNFPPVFKDTFIFNINTGGHFTSTDQWTVEYKGAYHSGKAGDYDKYFYADMNNDGLVDFVYNDEDELKVRINKGNDYLGEAVWHSHNSKDGTFNGLADFDGDGYPDLSYRKDDKFYVRQNNLATKNILTKITNNITNAFDEFEYAREYCDANSGSSGDYRNKYVLRSKTTGVKGLQEYKSEYKYENGYYDFVEKEFRGFSKVTASVEDKDKSGVYKIMVEEFYIDNKTGEMDIFETHEKYDQYLKGQLKSNEKRLVKKDTNGNEIYNKLLSKKSYKYKKVNVLASNDKAKFVYPYEVRAWLYDYNNNFLGVDKDNGDVVETYNYTLDNTSGLIIKGEKFSENDPNNDYDNIRLTKYYSSNTSNNKWLNLVYLQESKDHEGLLIYKKTNYYDNKGLNIITGGKLTKEQSWDVLKTEESDHSHESISYQYDNLGNMTLITDSSGLKTSISTDYNSAGYSKIVTTTHPDNSVTIAKFDKYGRLKESIDKFGNTTELTYDNYSRITNMLETINGELKETKKFTYTKDNTNNLFKVKTEYRDNHDAADEFIKVVFIKDALGREIQNKTEGYVTDEAGNSCYSNLVSGKIEFNAMGRITRKGPVSIEDINNVDNDNYVEKSISANDPVTIYAYDDFGRVASITTPSGLREEKVYEKIKETHLDSNNRTIDRILNKTASVFYDSTNNKVAESIDFIDQMGNTVRCERWKEGTAYSTTEYEYDLHGYGKVIDSKGETYEKTGEKYFDSLGRLKWMKTPDRGKFEYTYNEKNLVGSIIDYGKNEADTEKITSHYYYDDKNRMLRITYEGDTENEINYTYYPDTHANKYAANSIMKITKGSQDNPYFIVEYDYGQFWVKETKTIDGASYTSKYTYDVQGRINEVEYPDGEVVKYTYDKGGFLCRIEGYKAYIENILYNKEGQKVKAVYGNNTVMDYTYDKKTLLLDKYTVKDSTDNVLLDYIYTFSDIGNITKITDINSTQDYIYNVRSRLINAQGLFTGDTMDAVINGNTSYNIAYNYSDDNRILSKQWKDTSGNITKQYLYNYNNNTHAVMGINITDGADSGTIVFSYDDFGNMKEKVFTGLKETETQHYTYDINNRLKSVDFNGTTTDFMYDNRGQRIKKVYKDNVSTISETTYITGFYTIKDGAISKHITDGNYVIATKIKDVPDSIKYYHQNHIGSTALLTSNSGVKFQGYLFYPYGETWITDNGNITEDIDRLYTGQEFDKETGLYYFNARYYDPHIGMFMRPDPAMDGLNHYAYANCNPIMYNDPTGLLGTSSAGASSGTSGFGGFGGFSGFSGFSGFAQSIAAALGLSQDGSSGSESGEGTGNTGADSDSTDGESNAPAINKAVQNPDAPENISKNKTNIVSLFGFEDPIESMVKSQNQVETNESRLISQTDDENNINSPIDDNNDEAVKAQENEMNKPNIDKNQVPDIINTPLNIDKMMIPYPNLTEVTDEIKVNITKIDSTPVLINKSKMSMTDGDEVATNNKSQSLSKNNTSYLGFDNINMDAIDYFFNGYLAR